MAENSNETTMEFTEEDFYRGAVVPRVNSLFYILEDILPGADVDQQIGDNGLPFVRVSIDDEVIDLKYFAVGEPDEGRYILLLQSTVFEFENDDKGYVMECAGFNFGSAFGYAVYDPVNMTVELRAQTPEAEGILPRAHYENLIALFLYGISELRNSIEG
ncbi:MAG: hypothetical protein K6B14_10710 [Lachnospiraceae bacterium]|nr:hypothetical protein [Lachnospiraceae bacterium]